MKAAKKAEAAQQPANTPTPAELRDAAARKVQQHVVDQAKHLDELREHCGTLEVRILGMEKQLYALVDAVNRGAAKQTALRQRVEALEKAVGVQPPAQRVAVPLLEDDDELPVVGRR